ncbi:MAG: hypothetical protein AB7V25_11750 [Mangrovibacterium sp.]
MKKVTLLLFVLALFFAKSYAQTFEEEKIKPEAFEKVTPRIGADFALQFQGINNSADGIDLMPLGTGFNLPTTNLNLGADLAPGMKVYLRTYLSSRHHNESWVQGGYLLVDAMPFIKSEAVDKLMQYMTLKIGVGEVNYGDGHFRRSDNAAVINNPFVGNYVMDAFTTAPMFEVMLRNNGWIGMVGVTDGSLNPTLVTYDATAKEYNEINTADELGVYGKFGFDKQLSDDLRLRLTVSPWIHGSSRRGTLYSGDRAGSRYYQIMVPASQEAAGTDIKKNHLNGNWGPGAYSEMTTVMFNSFLKYKGLEFFGLYETADGKTTSKADFNFDQLALEGLVRFGGQDQFYGGLRYNRVTDDTDSSIDRVQVGAGWFLTKNVLAKLEYVNQQYNNFEMYGGDAEFKGVMFEAAISF